MKNSILLTGFSSLLMLPSVFFMVQTPAVAQDCNYFAGTASTGESVNVDICNLSITDSGKVDFVYYLGNQKVISQADCEAGSWTTFPEKEVHRPQSQATQRMLDAVCSYSYSSPSNSSSAVVFAPPSNVRQSPNGNVLCSIDQVMSINIYGSDGDWYYTDACGSMGVIHSSQVRF